MSKIMYKGISYANAGVSSDTTSIPTADMTAAFDSTAHMNSTDMTSQEVEDFVDGLDVGASQKFTVVHSKYDGSATLSTNATTYYNIFENLSAGLWIIFLTHYTPVGEVIVCYGSDFNNSIIETSTGGQSGAGIINLASTTTIQMYVTHATTISRFKAEALKVL